ncbi:pectate lyase [Uliginosibacterium sp. IMCC34675]|uniref:Pectate lyase n=1 Tax=Uliginosibacterium aquaticum TaxID=2731212 RepID=A0ABX2IQK1_9RHOO|nr:pectate lyase [Uliginosibacterium aquaticum]
MVPANGATGAYVDTTLQITFDSAPTLGSSGYIYVYKSSDNTLVDKISLNVFSTGSWADDATASTPALTASALSTYNTTTLPLLATANTEVDKIGNVSTLTQYRWVLYRPVTISGKTATIKLHDNKLAPSTGYYVLMDSGVLNGNINGSAYNGISSSSVWGFTTKADPVSTTDIVVDDDGSADYRTVQGALNWLLKNCGGTNASTTCGTSAKTITIKNGTYTEMLYARNLNNLTIKGETRDGAIVQYDMYNDFNPGTGGSATLATVTGTNLAAGKAQKAKDGLYRAYLGGGRPVFLVEGSDLLNLTQFTLQNTHVKDASYNNQAETIYYNSSTLNGSRLTASYMNFFSTQDTIQAKGWTWIYKSLVKGDVDYIWGATFATLIEDSELRTVVDTSDPTKGGYVIEARAAYGYPGFVVLNSSLTKEAGVPDNTTMLARQAGTFAVATYCNTMMTSGSLGNANYGCNNVAFINTKMGTHINTAGWDYTYVPPITSATTTTGYRESGSMNLSGATLDVSGRSLTYASTTQDLSGLNATAKVFAQWNSNAGWAPTAASCTTSACTTSK